MLRKSWLLRVTSVASIVLLAETGRTKCGESPDQSSAELRELENRLQSAAERTLPTVVSFIGAAGVIVSPEGLILSQSHVTHPETAKVGDKVKVILHDGTVAEAELLGADRIYDLSAVRLTKPGPYSFAALADHDPEPGSSVLKMGYPGPLWFKKGRPPEVRFGTVLATTGDTFLTDCRLNGGDSGGPFFDLDGRLVGILKVATPVRDQPSQQALWAQNLGMVRGGWWWRATASSLIRTRLARMAKGEIITTPDPVPADSTVDKSLVVQEPILQRQLIPADDRTQGRKTITKFRGAVADARKSVVEIMDGSESVALGTVVDVGGLIVTKASEVPDKAHCRLPDGNLSTVDIVGIDPARDLALLRVSDSGLVPIKWAKIADPTTGTFLAACGTGELPVAIGIVSLQRRETSAPYPTVPSRYRRKPAAAPQITGSLVEGVGYQVETSAGRAAEAGIQPGDVIVSIAGAKVLPPDDMKALKAAAAIPAFEESTFTFRGVGIFEERHVGDRVPVKLLRKREQMEVSLQLEGIPDSEADAELFSEQSKVPPTVVCSDIPILPHECGAPVVDIEGRAIGIVIARFGPSGSFVIPADVVAARLDDLKEGKPLSGFSASSAREAEMVDDTKAAPSTSDERADEHGQRPNLLIIGASSLNSPVALTQLVGAMLENKKIPMHVEGEYPHLDEVNRLLSSQPAWDFVIIDAWHLGRASADGSQGNASVPPDFPKAVTDFVKQVRAHSPKCKIILFPWWIPRGATATKEGVMEVFRRCIEEAKANDTWVATTGPAFMEARLDRPDLHITVSETDAHPGIEGAYLNACSLFAITTDKSPVGLPAKLKITGWDGARVDFTVAPQDAKYLQELAWKVYQREIKNTKPAK